MGGVPLTGLQKFETAAEYRDLERWMDELRMRDKEAWVAAMRWYATNDLFFLHRYVVSLGRAIHSTYGTFFFDHDMYVQACRQYEKQLQIGSSLDVSCRRSGKSEIRCTTVPIYLMLSHPDIAMCLFSTELKLANKHMIRLMNELERNKMLLYLFPDHFYADPREESKQGGIAWSKADGFCIKGRKINRSTQTFEVHALFGGGPVGSGYDAIFFDDVESSSRVHTKTAIEDLDSAFSSAISLLTPVVLRTPVVVVSNTRFSEAGLIHRLYDRYRAMSPERVRAVPGEDVDGVTDFPDDWYTGYGPLGGRSIYPNTPENLTLRYEEVPNKSEYILQYGLSYKSVSDRAFNKDRINYYTDDPKELARDCVTYMCIDPSRGKIDPMCIWVWGMTSDRRKIWLDAIVKKLDPTNPEFHDTVFRMATQWNNLSQRLVEIRIEDTTNSTWTELIEKELRDRGCYLNVRKVKVRMRQVEGKFKTGKQDRIYDHWAPMINRGEVWFPSPQSKGGKGMNSPDETGKYRCLVDHFHQYEFDNFPVSKTDNMLDAGGMIEDEITNIESPLQYGFNHNSRRQKDYGIIPGAGWMSA